jgi:hypothetical protein
VTPCLTATHAAALNTLSLALFAAHKTLLSGGLVVKSKPLGMDMQILCLHPDLTKFTTVGWVDL